MCCSVLQCIAVQFGAVWCSVLQCVVKGFERQFALGAASLDEVKVLQSFAVCCSVLQCVAVCCGVLQCVATLGDIKALQCFAVCSSELLQCATVYCSKWQKESSHDFTEVSIRVT